MPRDSLRATLDSLHVDPASAQDRPYLEAMLRRLGYTEKEIRTQLPPVADAGAPPANPADGVAQADEPFVQERAPVTREYRLVLPAAESAFILASGQTTDSPLEEGATSDGASFEVANPDDLEFEEVASDASPASDAPLEWQDEQAETLSALGDEPVQADDADALPLEEDASSLDQLPMDTFGGADTSPSSPTRVRVKRVRAKSRAEAEAKVASTDRRVIKAVPVDIVERWGDKDQGAR